MIRNPDIARHPVLEKAFLEFQLASFHSEASHSSTHVVEIGLPDGKFFRLDYRNDEPTDAVMKKLADAVGIREDNLQHFGLFLTRPRHPKNELGTGVFGNGEIFDQICKRHFLLNRLNRMLT